MAPLKRQVKRAATAGYFRPGSYPRCGATTMDVVDLLHMLTKLTERIHISAPRRNLANETA